MSPHPNSVDYTIDTRPTTTKTHTQTQHDDAHDKTNNNASTLARLLRATHARNTAPNCARASMYHKLSHQE